MVLTKALLLSASLSAIPRSLAWGTLGHETVALIAQNFVSSDTATWAKKILSTSSTTYLADVATWADSYRYTTAGEFSAPYHYIDANDSPPSSCNVDYDRDCGTEGCVVSAITNYTARVVNTKLSTTEQQMALKWIVHFLGDIHQPLHDEALDVGGNTIKVTFDGTSTNLHAIWDTNMPEKLVGGYALSDAQSWAKTLITQITNGTYKSEASSWLTGMNIKDPQSSSMIWATDSNAYVCTAALKGGVSAVSGKELDGSYYDTAIPVIELQIAKAGYRLAAWLNYIATGKSGLSTRSEREFYGPRGLRQVRGVQVAEWDTEKIEAARRVRRAWGWNCGPEGHEH